MEKQAKPRRDVSRHVELANQKPPRILGQTMTCYESCQKAQHSRKYESTGIHSTMNHDSRHQKLANQEPARGKQKVIVNSAEKAQ